LRRFLDRVSPAWGWGYGEDDDCKAAAAAAVEFNLFSNGPNAARVNEVWQLEPPVYETLSMQLLRDVDRVIKGRQSITRLVPWTSV